MSTIFGVLRWDGLQVEPAMVAAFKRSLAPRSPDGFCVWMTDGAFLGHGMLDPAGQGEPLGELVTSEDLIITADLRLDNQSELRKKLAVPSSASDEALVLSAYRRWGSECAARLEGDFAFVILDQTRRSAFCARDRLAARPLNYVRTPSYFAFASIPETLTLMPEISAAPNEEFVASLLVPYEWDTGHGATWYRDIRVLNASERADVSASGINLETYWDLRPEKVLKLPNDQAYIECFWEHLDRSVARRIGLGGETLMLSGGMDSASIVASLKRQSRLLRSCSVVSGDAADNESKYIRLLQHEAPLQHASESIVIEPDAPWWHSLKALLRDEAHPVENSVPLPALVVEHTRKHSRVVLHGAVGDITQTWDPGLPVRQLRAGKLHLALAEIGAQYRYNTYLQHHSYLYLVARSLWKAYAPDRLRRIRRLRAKQDGMLNSLISPALVERLKLEEKRRQFESEQVRLARDRQPGDVDASAVMGQIQSCQAGFDRMFGRRGMIGRDVWADCDLVQFFMSLPLEQRTRRGWTKYLTRIACSEWLPPLVCWRQDKDHLGWALIEGLYFKDTQGTRQQLFRLKDILSPFVEQSALNSLLSCSTLKEGDKDILVDLLSIGMWLSNSAKMGVRQD